jgi:hypothetical protein
MRVSKVLMTGFMVVMIAALTFTTVGAQAEPPPVEDAAAQDSSIGVDAAVVPVSPYAVIVYTRKPVFTFLKNYDAKAYQIQVREQSSATVVYTYKGSGTCNNYVCWLQPDTKLDMAGAAFNGIYEWRVNYKIGTMWHVYSAWIPFAVYKSKFNSTFDLNYKNWNVWYGPWMWDMVKGRIWTLGDNNYYNSMYYSYFFPSFDYTVRMKRKVNISNTNSVVVWGKPSPTTSWHQWSDAVYVNYRNNREVSVWQITGGGINEIMFIPDCAAVNPFGWNEFRVVGIYPYLDIWLNGTYLGYVELSTLPISSYLGFDTFTNSLADQKYLVDWAKASVPDLSASMTHDPAMNLTMDPVEVEVPQ